MPNVPPPTIPFVPLLPYRPILDPGRVGVALALFAADERFGFQVDVAPDSGGAPNTGSITSYLIPGTTRTWEYETANDGAPRWFRVLHVADGYDPSTPTPWVSGVPKALPAREGPPTDPVGPVIAQANTQDATNGSTTLTVTDPQDRVTLVEFQTTVAGVAGAWTIDSAAPYQATVPLGTQTAPNLIAWRVTGYNAQGVLGYLAQGSNAFGVAPGANPQALPPVATLTQAVDAVPRQFTSLVLGYTTQGSVAPGTMQYRYRVDPGDGTGSAAYGAWTNFSGATTSLRVQRANLYTKTYFAQVRDSASGLVSQEVQVDVTGYLQSIDDATGYPFRSVPFTDNGYAAAASTGNGYNLHSSVVDSGGRLATGFFSKPIDTIANVTDDGLGTIAGGRLGYQALDASGLKAGKLLRGRALDDGSYTVRAQDTAGHILDSPNVYEPVSGSYFTQTFMRNVHTAANITDDGAGALAGGRLGYSTLDASGLLAGKLVRARTGSDGYYSAIASTTDGRSLPGGLVYDGGTGAYLNTAFYRGVHTMDNIVDGGTYVKTTAVARDGGIRGYNGLDSGYGLTTTVRDLATIGGRYAGVLGRAVFSSVFAEQWDNAGTDPSQVWEIVNELSNSNHAVVASASSTRGANILTANSFVALNLNNLIPFDATKLYRFRARIQKTGSAPTYIGVLQKDYQGNQTNANSGAGYILCGGDDFSGQGWRTLTTWVRGASVAYGTTSLGSGGTPAAPVALNAGTVAIMPYLLLNYNDNSGTNTVVDFYEITEYDEDGQSRTYGALDSNARIQGQRNLPMCTVANVSLSNGGTVPIYCTWDSASSTWTIHVSGYSPTVGGSGQITYPGATLTGYASNTTYFVYCDDPTYAGVGAYGVTTNARTAVAGEGRALLGTLTTGSASGGTPPPPDGGGSTCVAADTPVLLADGTERAAGDLRPGDVLATYLEDALTPGAFAVTHASTHQARRYRLRLHDGRELLATSNHRVFVLGRGWTRLFVLQPGDVLVGPASGIVRAVVPHDRGPVVKLTVADAHTYVSRGLLSHNQKPV